MTNCEMLDRVETDLMSSEGKHYVILATTANLNNPPFYVGGLRKGAGVVAANFIFSAPDILPEVIARFDGRIDAFLVDTEVKNSLVNLEEQAEKLIHNTPIIRIKPNDMTVLALDLWMTLLFPSLRDKKILIVGAGNIGAKIALILAERGAVVRLLGREQARLEHIIRGINEIKRGHGHVELADKNSPAMGSNIVLGCTPGVPAITHEMIGQMAQDSIIIDIGNGTLFPDAIDTAHQHGIRVFCLSPESGFVGWVAALAHAGFQIDHMKRRVLPNNVSVIGPGILGAYGDVIVDNTDNWQRILGVCDGRGDVLHPNDGENFIKKLPTK